jgi:hypothetical protein
MPTSRKKQTVAALQMDHADLAARIQRTFANAYKTLVQNADLDDAVQALAVLLAQSAEAIEQADRAAEAAKAGRVAIIRCMMAVGMTMEDIGAVHGLSRQRIGQLLRAYESEAPIPRPAQRRNGRAK